MLPDGYQLSIHAGTHCTGSDRFHHYLALSRADAENAGWALAYPGRYGAAGGMFDCTYPDPRHQGQEIEAFAARIANALSRHEAASRGMILSDPDLAGTMANLMGGRFYPAAAKRAEALRLALGRPVDRLVLAVQPYETLFRAVWRRFALDREMEPFAEYAPAMSGFIGGWVETVEALRDGLGAREVIVLARMPEPAELLSYLAPGLRSSVSALPGGMPEITQSGLAMIQRHYRMGGRFAAGQRERILAFHARQPQLPPEAGFEGLPLADLRGRYVADLDTIARMTNVSLLGGSMPELVPMAAE
ncbi:MAG: hypothetical protein KDE03_03105 [Rhodobacteraceae bacterium]|nr:hypothetical protein [Paracoccaceae bacterium]